MTRKQDFLAIEAVLHSMGLIGSTLAMREMILAAALAHEDRRLLTNISKGLYSRVAAEFGETTEAAVEHNLRKLRDRQWERGDRTRLQEMAMYDIIIKPTTGEFIDIVRYYMESNDMFRT